MLQFTITFQNEIILLCRNMFVAAEKKTNKKNIIMCMYYLGRYEHYWGRVWTSDDYILKLMWHDNATKETDKQKIQFYRE